MPLEVYHLYLFKVLAVKRLATMYKKIIYIAILFDVLSCGKPSIKTMGKTENS